MVHFVFSPYIDGFGPYLGTGFFLSSRISRFNLFPFAVVLHLPCVFVWDFFIAGHGVRGYEVAATAHAVWGRDCFIARAGGECCAHAELEHAHQILHFPVIFLRNSLPVSAIGGHFVCVCVSKKRSAMLVSAVECRIIDSGGNNLL